MEPFLIVGGILVLVAGIAGFVWYLENKRAQALQAFAQSLNLSFTRKGAPAQIQELACFHLFGRGHSQKISNMMKGTANGIDLTLMDYRYTVGSGKNSNTHSQTVLLFESDLLKLPAFSLRPENIFHKIGAAFGYKDIDFKSHPIFSKMYLLRSPNEQAVIDCFTDDKCAFFEKNKGVCVEAIANTLIVYRSSKRPKPDKLREFMEEGYRIFELFKESRSL